MRIVAKAFVVHDHKIILILRDNEKDLDDPNSWSLPGGNVEEGESALSAIKRELKEELNIDPGDVIELEVIKQPKNHYYLFLINLSKQEFEAIKLGDEGQKWEAFKLDKLTQIPLTKNLKEYLYLKKDQLKELAGLG